MAIDALRTRLAVTATAALVGVVLSTAFDQTLGGFVTVASVIALVATLHRFGRTGAD
ncbi:MAG TPA: hypothetical protein VH062_08750 [Polyangiaceae bacterium]|jgi:hypothetical protein|nr:hypothetical protein [Polyangiaceae bacterium]